MIRRIAAILAATAMLLVLALPVMAGGWAEIVADGQTITPKEGSSVEIGFRVMQHGETPAPWEGATVRFTNSSTGETFDVVAKNDRPDGHFVASATMPDAGYWSWQVTLQNLESDHVPVRFTVLTASGATPQFDPSSVLAAVDNAKIDVTNTLGQQIGSEVQRLDTQDDYFRGRIDSLVAENKALTAELEGTQNKLVAMEGAGGLPLLGVIALAVLAGASAGFAMAWLAGRAPRNEGSAVALKPAPRGGDPV
jgi:hypothetical protein